MNAPSNESLRATTRTRREFLTAGAATIAAPYFISSRALAAPGRPGANDQVRIGVIGCGVRGKYLIANLPPAGRVVALCDCSLDHIADTRQPKGVFARPLAAFAETDAEHCTTHQDYRRMMDREKLDAVMIATPDHHHVLAAVLACQAGLDVYCEKPLTLTIAEGRVLVDAVRRYGRVLQVGSQQRTMEANRFACQFVRDGRLGKVSLVEVPNFPGPMPLTELPAEEVPATLDWDLFLGPTPHRPHNQKIWVKEEFRVGQLLWRGWDLFRPFSGHLMTNWGGHTIDMVQYALGTDDDGPVEIWPETQPLNPAMADPWADKTPPVGSVADRTEDLMRFCAVSMRYASGIELRFTSTVDRIVVHGERGKMIIQRNSYRTDPPDLAPRPDPQEQRRWTGAGHVARPHIDNWLQCLRSRTTPHAPVEYGHRTATICHLANLARQLARPLRWDPRREQFPDDEQANQWLDRPRRAGFELPRV